MHIAYLSFNTLCNIVQIFFDMTVRWYKISIAMLQN